MIKGLGLILDKEAGDRTAALACTDSSDGVEVDGADTDVFLSPVLCKGKQTIMAMWMT